MRLRQLALTVALALVADSATAFGSSNIRPSLVDVEFAPENLVVAASGHALAQDVDDAGEDVNAMRGDTDGRGYDYERGYEYANERIDGMTSRTNRRSFLRSLLTSSSAREAQRQRDAADEEAADRAINQAIIEADRQVRESAAQWQQRAELAHRTETERIFTEARQQREKWIRDRVVPMRELFGSGMPLCVRWDLKNVGWGDVEVFLERGYEPMAAVGDRNVVMLRQCVEWA